MKKTILLTLICLSVLSCKNTSEEKSDMAESSSENTSEDTTTLPEDYKISLAQWSLHRRYEAADANPLMFARDAKDLGFEAVEFVSQLYSKQIESYGFEALIDSLKVENEKYGVRCVLIMVDEEGDLADPDPKARDLAVEKHKKWVDATVELGGHAIRVNTFGTNDLEVWKTTVVDGLKKLSEYAATKNINVLCENHGWLSSDPNALMQAISEVDMENCGTLPDFGNWCIERANGERWGACVNEYSDYYKGLELLMPAAKAVSAKAYAFDENGNETKIDYYKMMKIVIDSGYKGYIGVEYESDTLDEVAGILATKALLEKAINAAN